MLRSVLAVAAGLVLFVIGWAIHEARQESTALQAVVRIRQERDRLYEPYNSPENGARNYLEALELIQPPADSSLLDTLLKQTSQTDWEAVVPVAAPWLAAQQPAIEQIRRGNRKPWRLMPRVERADDRLPSIYAIRLALGVLVGSGKQAEIAGRLDGAVGAYLDGVLFGYGLETDRALVMMMAGLVVREVSLTALRQALPRLSDQELLVVLHDLESWHHDAVPLNEAFKTEALGMVSMMTDVYAGTTRSSDRTLERLLRRALRNPLLGWYLGQQRTCGHLARVFLCLARRAAMPYPDAVHDRRCDHLYQAELKGARSWVALLDQPIAKLMAAVAVPNVERAHEVFARGQAYERATRAVAALHILKQRQGSFPSELRAVVGLVSSDAIVDPFLDAPFRYQSNGVTYTLYSIGPDLVDDGGRPCTDIVVKGCDLVF